ncbi:MAG: hypothetical protein Q8R69_25970 [Telluria sp.]|nr:hypothetical protein [Telluria sp.]
MLEQAGIKGLWVLARYLPPFLLRRRFTAERLAGLVYVDVIPRNDAVSVNLATPATATVYMQVINLAPVAIQLEQAEFRLTCGSVSTKFTVVRKQRFEVGQIGTIYFDQTIQDSQARAIAAQLKDLRVSMDGHIEFSSAIRSFARSVHHLDGIRARVVNENFWRESLVPAP